MAYSRDDYHRLRHCHIVLTLVLALILCASLAKAQVWVKITDKIPSVRWGCAMAYDSDRGVSVLFGGRNSSGFLGDTWEWDGLAWKQKGKSGGPPGRRYHAMAYDSDRDVVVLFGGLNSAGSLGDTWVWDGAMWKKVSSSGPSPRWGAAMAHDSERKVTFLFGGFNSTDLDDTWKWDGLDWKQVDVKLMPLARSLHAMAFDANRKKVVLYGGVTGTTEFMDTWEFNGSKWTKVDSGGPGSPGGRFAHTMAFDSKRNRVVLFAGTDNYGVLYGSFNDLWQRQGGKWMYIDAATKPTIRDSHAMAYDIKRDRVVAFGGLNYCKELRGDTWEYGLFLDLSISLTKVSPWSVEHGGKFRIKAKVKNVGGVKSAPTTVEYYLSTNKKLDANDILLGTKNIKGLKKNKSKIARLKTNVSSSIPAGKYWVIVQALVNDANTGDNRAISYQKVRLN